MLLKTILREASGIELGYLQRAVWKKMQDEKVSTVWGEVKNAISHRGGFREKGDKDSFSMFYQHFFGEQIFMLAAEELDQFSRVGAEREDGDYYVGQWFLLVASLDVAATTVLKGHEPAKGEYWNNVFSNYNDDPERTLQHWLKLNKPLYMQIKQNLDGMKAATSGAEGKKEAIRILDKEWKEFENEWSNMNTNANYEED